MPRTRIDVPGLYAALDGARRERELSWRQVAAEVGCSPSTMTRLANGHRPDADAFVALTTWLRMPAEKFMISDDTEGDRREPEQPDLMAQMGVLLRAQPDLSDEEKQHLQDVVLATLRLNSARRATRDR